MSWLIYLIINNYALSLKAPITTAADDIFCDIIFNFQKKGMIFHENCLPANCRWCLMGHNKASTRETQTLVQVKS